MISEASGWSAVSSPALDAMQDADGEDRVLVDRVHVVHVVLHLGDDAAEIGHEAAEHARLVQASERRFRILARGQHLHEDRGWPRDLAQRESISFRFWRIRRSASPGGCRDRAPART
jgi:hypothetical protein